MNKEEKPAIVENKDGTDGKKEEESSNDGANSKMTTGTEMSVAIKVAIIGAAAAIIAAIIAGLLPFLITRSQATPAPTIAPISSPTPFVTTTLMPSFINTLTPVVLPSLTDTPSIVIVPTDTLEPSTPSPRLFVNLVADKTSGKPSLAVKFNARSSYLLTPDGIQHPCQNGPCHYTWKVYSNGQQSGKSVTDSGFSFDHTFSEKGSYFVTVQVCWGQERLYCADDGTSIEVAR